MLSPARADLVSDLRSLGARHNNLLIRGRNGNLRPGDRRRLQKILTAQKKFRKKLARLKKAERRAR